MKVEHLKSAEHNCNLLEFEVKQFREQYPDETQFCITSKLGDNNFLDGAGYARNEQDQFVNLNPYFEDTTISKLVSQYPEYFRWRILCIQPKRTYSIHFDGRREGLKNRRLHIPVITNPEAFLVFYESPLEGNGSQRIEHHHLEVGEVYEVDTQSYHTAVNYHHTDERIHIVAERFIPYE